MPTSFERNLSLCFNKIKRLQSPPPQQPPQLHRHSNTKLIKNFNTLYDIDSDETSTTVTITDTAGTTTAADFSSAVASNRFFFSSPGRSNSIIESSSPSTSSLDSTSFTPEDGFAAVNGGFAIPTISPDPYYDFRKSMQEMVESRDDLIDARAKWDYLHELLTCYLDLNPKSAHKFIIGAFADILVTLMAEENGGCRSI